MSNLIETIAPTTTTLESAAQILAALYGQLWSDGAPELWVQDDVADTLRGLGYDDDPEEDDDPRVDLVIPPDLIECVDPSLFSVAEGRELFPDLFDDDEAEEALTEGLIAAYEDLYGAALEQAAAHGLLLDTMPPRVFEALDGVVTNYYGAALEKVAEELA